jgi:hypothetical protein
LYDYMSRAALIIIEIVIGIRPGFLPGIGKSQLLKQLHIARYHIFVRHII